MNAFSGTFPALAGEPSSQPSEVTVITTAQRRERLVVCPEHSAGLGLIRGQSDCGISSGQAGPSAISGNFVVWHLADSLDVNVSPQCCRLLLDRQLQAPHGSSLGR